MLFNRRRDVIRAITGGVCLVALACTAGEPADTVESAPVRPQPGAALLDLERRLMEASDVRVEFTVTATGSHTAELAGRLLLANGGRARLEATGTLEGQEVELLFVSNGARMRIVGAAEPVEGTTPPDLRRAIVIGLTRMGIGHNLARIAQGMGPDHADGGMEVWAQAAGVRRNEQGAIDFEVRVDGATRGTALLFMAPVTELPGERRQLFDLEEGEMEVREHYSVISIGGGIDSAEFVLD